MNKNLEREYRALVSSEVPDLWARIEAGLDDKKTVPEKKAPETDFPEADSQVEHVRSKKVNFKAWAGLAAACVCAALIVPAVARTMIMQGSSSGSYSNTASSDTLQNDTPQAAESCEKAEGAGPEAADEAAAGAAAAAVENGMSHSTAALDSENTAVISNTDTVNVDSSALEEEETYSFRVTVEILDTGVSMNGGILYTAKAITSENPNIETDSEIKVLSPTVTLEDSKTYDLMLSEAHLDDSEEEKTYLIVNDTVE